MRHIVCLLTGLIFLAGCQDISYANSAYQQKLGNWIGSGINSLYAAWGQPQQITAIDGNTILVTYYSSERRPIDNDYLPYAGELSYGAMAVPNYGLPTPPPLFYCKTSFVIRNGIVIDYNFNGDDCY